MSTSEAAAPSAAKDAIDSNAAAAARAELTEIARAAASASDREMSQVSALLADLLAAAELFGNDADAADRAVEIIDFCQTALADVNSAMNGCEEAQSRLGAVQDTARTRWGDYPDLLPDGERCLASVEDAWEEALPGGWESSDAEEFESDSNSSDDSAAGIDLKGIVASLDLLAAATPQKSPPAPARPAPPPSGALEAPPLLEHIEDPELLSSYIDDAHQCLAGMESSLLAIEAGAGQSEPLQQFCRELHTLKGASGTVGLAALAAYLHELESRVAAMSQGTESLDTDMLLKCVDAVRAQMQALQPDGDFAAAPAPVTTPALQRPAVTPDDAPSNTKSAESAPGEAMIRLEASRLDRLMDLLAELVLLRNRRDTYAVGLRQLQSELSGCANRIRAVDAVMPLASSASPAEAAQENDPLSSTIDPEAPGGSRQLSRSLMELAGDVSELGRSLQSIIDPFSADNLAVSDLIGEFRRELMELRRLPMAGLFQRLCRAARDAARTEGKQVEFQLVGQGTRAERSLQERLFEPLMHLVRNAVSHGVEDANRRAAAGKPAAGRITLEATSDASTLTIEIRDDGAGINEEAVERRGRELGLLPLGQPVNRERLWKLIFHPGFSTRTEVSSISGRGVGMDVVASWIRQLRGRIDIESVSGKGATFRLQIPLRSAIEHALIVRVGTQLFALPMRGVDTASSDSAEGLPAAHLRTLLGMEQAQLADHRVIQLRQPRVSNASSEGTASHLSIPVGVDAVLGVEEVVIRSLPPLLQGHELFAGVTLSGQSETVLLFDVPRLCELVQQAASLDAVAPEGGDFSPMESNSARERVLVVDDSLSVRRSIVRRLNARGVRTVEASDGLQALDVLRGGGIIAVVSDLDMPRMGGVELLVEMRHGSRYRDIPVTIVSSRDDEPTMTRLREMRTDCILKKPVTDETVSRIMEVVEKGLGTRD
jgi:chemotaxis protein histidine kinase CheA/CheY-like chemotaxis protein